MLSTAAAQEVRTWTDSTGKHTIKAKFIGLADGKVTLQREDGGQVAIPLEKLSEADRKVVADMQSAEQSPFRAAKPARKSARKKAKEEEEPEEKDEAGVAKVVTPRWTSARQVTPASGDNKWDLSIQAPALSGAKAMRPITIPARDESFRHIKAMAINPVCQRAVIGCPSDGMGRRSGGKTRLVLCDLRQAQVINTATVSERMLPLALDDSGTRVALRQADPGHSSPQRLEIWEITESGVNRLLQWNPCDESQRMERETKWARFVGEDKLITASGGRLVLWNAANAKPLYWVKMAGSCIPALSPDLKYVAFSTDKDLAVLDVAAGEVVAMQPLPKDRVNFPVFAFTPKGTRLACTAFDRLLVWDVATGALYRDIPFAGTRMHIGDNLVCPSEEHVLVGNRLLLDIESQAKLWSYRGHEMVAMSNGICWFAVNGEISGALVPAVLPQPSAVQKIRSAMDSADFFVLKPGVAVKLDVSGLPDPAEREKAAAVLTEKLKRNGFEVAASGQVALVALADPPKRREITYRTLGRGMVKTYTIQEYVVHAKVVSQGQTAWEVSATSHPGFVHLKAGETLEEVLKRSERPHYEWFAKLELPKVVQRPSKEGATLGTTEVTTAGVP